METTINDATEEYCFENECDYIQECTEINVTDEVVVESAWSQTIIGYLLDEIMKKKKDLHDPRHRRNKFFAIIRDQMEARGFCFTAKTLEKKFHNLKKHFSTICHSRDTGMTPRDKPITWPYYQQMMEIFAEELEIEDAPTMASLYPDPIPPKNVMLVKASSKKIKKEIPVVNVTLAQDELEEPNEHPEIAPRNDDGEMESNWEHTSVMAFLEECIKRKYQLWDPQYRRRSIFNDIRKQLRKMGLFFHVETLDRKLRNMKKQFQVAADSKVGNPPKRRRVTWSYYEQLKEIYGEEMEKEMRHKTKPQATTLGEKLSAPNIKTKFRHIAPKGSEPITAATSTPIIGQNVQVVLVPVVPQARQVVPIVPQKVECIDIQPSSPGEFDGNHFSYDDTQEMPMMFEESLMHAGKKPTFICEKLKFSLDVLALEERRTVVAEKMLDEFIESNRIKQKQLQLKRLKLEYALKRAKIKKEKLCHIE